MNFFKRLFSTQKPFVGNFIETDEELKNLISSNKIAQAEFEDFQKRVEGLQNEAKIKAEAIRSASALSGYGISVSPKAFIEAIK